MTLLHSPETLCFNSLRLSTTFCALSGPHNSCTRLTHVPIWQQVLDSQGAAADAGGLQGGLQGLRRTAETDAMLAQPR